MRRSLPTACVFLIALAVGGCAPARREDAPAASGPSRSPLVALVQGSAAPENPRDAQQALQVVFHVEIFLLSVPEGSISGNDEFWKEIDEQAVDPATYDLLYKNGVRVGVAPVAGLQHFAQFMDAAAPVEKLAIAGQEVKNAQIELKPNIPEQTIFHFDRTNTAVGRSFDRSTNVMNVSFEPAPRKPGQLRMTLCPMVRAERKKLQYTALNEQFEIQYVNPEMFYDLNMRVDIPMDSFLIVTPSPEARREVSVGHAFLIQNAPAQRLEQVLIIIPQPYRVQSANPAR